MSFKSMIYGQISMIIMMLWTLNTNVYSKQYYCNPTLGLLSNSGSADQPWGRLEDVINSGLLFEGGDTIFLSAGNHGTVALEGTNADFVTIVGNKGAYLNNLTVGKKGATSNWNLLNLNIQNEGAAVNVYSEASKIHLNGLTINGFREDVGEAQIKAFAARSVGIKLLGNQCWVENCNILGQGIAIYNQGSFNQIVNNVLSRFVVTAIETKGNYNVFKRNLITESYCLKGDSSIAILINNKLDNKPVVGNTISANQIINFKNNNRSFLGQLGGVVADVMMEKCLVENNVIVSNSHWGIKMPQVQESKIVNNTLVNPYFGIVLENGRNVENAISIGDFTQAKSQNIIIRNNIANNFHFENVIGVADHNITLTNEVAVYDCFFNSWAKFDFSLAESSPALNSGSFDGAPSLDISMVSRDLGRFINVGAFEYGKVDESDQHMVVYAEATDRELRSKGKPDWEGQKQIRIGGSAEAIDGVGVFPFRLPTLSGGKTLLEADFSVHLDKVDNVPNVHVDVYGLIPQNNAIVTPKMYYQGVYGQDLYARPIQNSFLTPDDLTGTYQLNKTGRKNLLQYLNNIYASGLELGRFVFLRLNPGQADVKDYHRWIVTSADVPNPKEKPSLQLTIGYPVAENSRAQSVEIKNKVIAASNPLDIGEVNLYLYGVDDENIEVAISTMQGERLIEMDLTSAQVQSGFAESINESRLPTGEYLFEVKGESFEDSYTLLVW